MSAPSEFATHAAERIWANAVGPDPKYDKLVVGAGQLFISLRIGLGRWIGASSYATIVERALLMVREDFPWLDKMGTRPDTEDMIRAAAEFAGIPQASDAGRILLAQIIELLGRIIGPEMAVHLVEHTGRPAQRPPGATNTEKGRDA